MTDDTWLDELNVGDTVYINTRDGLSKHVVTKFTPKQIVVGESRFYRETGREVGADLWYHKTLTQATPRIEVEYKAQQARRLLRSVQWSKLSDGDVIAVAEDVAKRLPKP